MGKVKNNSLEPQIIKIQQSLNTVNNPVVLIYNKKRDLFFNTMDSVIATKAILFLNGRKKAYALAQIIVNDINILEDIDTQNW
jgi:hypothetical protein